MRLSAKSRYAVTSLLDIVLHAEQGPVSLANVSSRQGISLSYLEQLFAKMRRHKLVISTHGPGGGYHLSDEPENIYITDIIRAVDEEIGMTRRDSLTDQLWTELSEQIQAYLSTISLADMMQNEEVKRLSQQHDLRHVTETRTQPGL